MNKLTIYYFSGTGNAKNVSNWMTNSFNKSGFTTELIDISKLKSRKINKTPANSIIGFCSPTHGFNFPPIMFHFLLRFPRASNNKVFIINTRAGFKFGKFFLPGLSGMAQFFSCIILLLKGYKIIGLKPIDLPSNWISFHPGIKPKIVDSIYKKCKYDVDKFANTLIGKKKDFSGLYTLPIDLLISPIAFLYYIIGRFILAKSFFASKDCTKCNLCIQSCPIQAIKTIDKRPFWTYKCESCMRCINICPEKAIEVSHGVFIGIYYLISSVLIINIYKLLYLNHFFEQIKLQWYGGLIRFVFDSALILGLFMVMYRIFHFLLRFKIFERIACYTSLTHIKSWRRYRVK